LLERLRRDPGVGAVCAVDHEPEARQVGAEPLDDVLEVAVGRDADVVDRAGRVRGGCVEERLDLLLDRVGQRAICLPVLGLVVLLCWRKQRSWRPPIIAGAAVFSLNLLVLILNSI